MTSLETTIAGLSVIYAALGVLLLGECLLTRLPWLVKAAAIVLVSGFYVAGFNGTRGLLGWSSDEKMPDNFKLLWVRVVEPSVVNGERGVVHMWVEALDKDDVPSGTPRGYKVPYTPKMAMKAAAALKATAAGHPQAGHTGSADADSLGGGAAGAALEPKSGEAGGQGDITAAGAREHVAPNVDDVSFSNLPSPHLPAKEEAPQ